MAMGIDQQIQQKVDAYRSDPNKLMARYQQNQQLIDLLALQKLKSEKESAARDMQMKMANSPKTIAEQREEEVLGLTKNELAAQTGKLLQQRQAQQQKNLAQVAQRGIAGQPAPNMARMAGGGIVAFATGGDTLDSKAKRIKAIQDDASLSVDEKKERIQAIIESGTQVPVGTVSSARPRGVMGTIPQGMETSALDVIGDQGGIKSVPVSAQINQQTTGQQPPAGQTTGQQPPAGQTTGQQPPAGQTTGQQPEMPAGGANVNKGDYSLDLGQVKTQVPTLSGDKYKVDYSGIEAEKGLLDLYKGLAAKDSTAAAKSAREEAMGYFGYSPDERAKLDALIQERKDMETARFDPDKMRRERLSAFLRGTANRSGIGSVLAGGSAEADVARGRQETAQYNLMAERQKMLEDQINKSQQIRQSAYGEGSKAADRASREIIAGAEGLGRLTREEAERRRREADAALKVDVAQQKRLSDERANEVKILAQNVDTAVKVDIANMQSETAQQKNSIQHSHNQIMAGITDRRYMQATLADIEKILADITIKTDAAYADRIADIEAGLVPLPEGRTTQDMINALNKEKNATIKAATNDLIKWRGDIVSRIRDSAAGSGTSGFTVTRKP